MQPDLHARLALQKAAHTLGMNIQEIYLRTHGTEVEMGHRPGTLFADTENLRQTAQALGQYCDVLAVYAPAQLQDAEQDYADTLLHYLRLYAQIPVFNLESALYHPWQALADWLTIEAFKKMEKPRVVLQWVPYDRPVSAAGPTSLIGLCASRCGYYGQPPAKPPAPRKFYGGYQKFLPS
ncbi:MAG: hypothetical protein HC913_13925 [Microscillaceae bacterium]|nr:hypothetical protein [Microscillaceae bacterium]